MKKIDNEKFNSTTNKIIDILCTLGLTLASIAIIIIIIIIIIMLSETKQNTVYYAIESIEESTEPIIITSDDIEETQPTYISLGEYTLTAYCPCKKCCGKWSGGKTKSGTTPQANRTIAVDESNIKMGSIIFIDGIEYVAEDTGGAIKGNKIDIFFNTHEEALNFGIKKKEVFIKNEEQKTNTQL